ncbi:hypothetical protein Ae201684_019115 [Aphanomyces euteiches]|uniref:Uncharacterized protein n=1 Tax=Aphanomyces euteiches TaxID=100861 RepID=A0A6G0W3I2_9STRA|nr:hypothetical protein Ae201684_019115 [Aphanomyces euteiches]
MPSDDDYAKNRVLMRRFVLHEAVRNGDLDGMVKGLLTSNTKIDGIHERSNQPLHVACESGHLAVIKFLLDKGAAINTTGHDNRTALHFASNYGYLDVVKSLLENGAALDMKSHARPLVLMKGLTS